MATRKTRRVRRLQAVLLILLAIWITVAFGRSYYENYQARQRLIELESDLRAYEIRNEQLEETLQRLQSPEYVERVAREELGLVQPGEKLYIITDP